MLEQLGSVAIALIILVILFYWIGGGEIIQFFKNRQLKKHIRFAHDIPAIQDKISQLQHGQLPTLTDSEVYLLTQAITGKEDWMPICYQAHRKEAHIGLFYGAYLIQKAWLARGSGSADSISQEGLTIFVNSLNEADSLLRPLLGEMTQKHLVLEKMLRVFQGLSQQQNTQALRLQYQQEIESDLPLSLSMLTQLSSRWGGDQDALFYFAKQAAKQSDIMSATLAAAWLEFAIDTDKKTMKKALANSDDSEHLLTVYQRLPKAPAQVTDSNEYSHVLAHNIFAVYFDFVGNKKMAKTALQNTRGLVTHYPWKYIDENILEGFYEVTKKYKVKNFTS